MFERGAECGDGDACTTGGTCTDGACAGIAPKDCDDNNSCTEDRCDAGTGCVHEALGDVVCDDGNACTEDECRKAEGCAHEPLSGQPCSDGDLCPDDACGAVSGCTHTPNGGSAEKCDGLDNDCDGSVDEQCSFPTCPLIAEFDKGANGAPIPAGTPVSDQYAPWLATFSATNNNGAHPDLAIAFDATNPTGEDTDLWFPNYGNLLIIAEDDVDSDGDGLGLRR